MGVAFDGLGRRNDGHPLLHVLAGGIALAAEEGVVLRCHILIAGQAEEQVGASRMISSYVLGGLGIIASVCSVL